MKAEFLTQLKLVPTRSIQVDWETRYRHGDWDEAKAQALALSIADHDILHPPVVRQNEDGSLTLGPGGHRLRAFLINEQEERMCPNPSYDGWKLIPVRICTGATDEEMAVLDLVENVQRRILSWQVKSRKVYDIHQQQRAANPDWTLQQTAALVGLSENSIGLPSRIWAFVLGAESDGDKLAAEQALTCSSENAADQLISRRKERVRQEELERIAKPLPERGKKEETKGEVGATTPITLAPNQQTPTLIPQTPSLEDCPILHTDFASFITSWDGPRFNFLHIDPPYGVGVDSSPRWNSKRDGAVYDDTTQDYFAFLSILPRAADTIIASSAHIIWWFPFKYLPATLDFFASQMVEWIVDPYPLIWHNPDRNCILPALGKSGRRTYESALLLTRGDRPLITVGDMSISHPKKTSDRIHISEKPKEVITAFCKMMVDDTTIALDPTAGSGRPLQAIQALGAKKVVGLEKSDAIHHIAFQDWIRWKRKDEHEKQTHIDVSNIFSL